MRDGDCKLDLSHMQRLAIPPPFLIHRRMPVLFTRAAFQAKFGPAVNGHNSTGFVQRLPS